MCGGEGLSVECGAGNSGVVGRMVVRGTRAAAEAKCVCRCVLRDR